MQKLLITLLYILPLASHFLQALGKNLVLIEPKNATNTSSTFSTYLWRAKDPRFIGCWRRPWICDQGDFLRTRRRCCRNRCVDVATDVNNCGLCGIRCPFTWQCCNGICINTNLNPYHCGRCDNRCRFPSLCFYGLCGYAQPLPPFPFPFPPRPPFPFPPRPPFPPKPFPPKPFPPKPFPPKPFPPKPHPPKPFPPKPFPPKPFPPKPHPPKGGQPGAPPVGSRL